MANILKITLLVTTLFTLTLGAKAETLRTVVVFGDSITAGSNLPPGTPKDALWLRVAEKENGGKFVLVNEGRGGRPTAAVGEFDAALARNPRCDLLVIALGGNDARDVSGSCVPNAVKNMGKIIARARKHYGESLPILLVGPFNINQEKLGPTYDIREQRDANLRALAVAFEKLAADTGCSFVNMYGVLPPDSLTADGVHPNTSGNAAIAHVMNQKINALLSEQKATVKPVKSPVERPASSP
jgi:acyl-CoA thioesterase-1